MNELNVLLTELGISKVRLAKYLGVSRQMLYNYLAIDNMNDWPKEKSAKLMNLLSIKAIEDIKDLKINGEYIIEVEKRLNDGVKDASGKELFSNIKGFNKKEQELLGEIVNLLKDRVSNENNKNNFNTLNYLYNFLQSMDANEELKYILVYMSKALGFTTPTEFVYNEEKQFAFEGILFSAMTMYTNGNGSKTRISESHRRFVADIEHKKEEKLSRTQELNTVKMQALKELGFTKITEDNAKEVLEKIAEIQTRKV